MTLGGVDGVQGFRMVPSLPSFATRMWSISGQQPLFTRVREKSMLRKNVHTMESHRLVEVLNIKGVGQGEFR